MEWLFFGLIGLGLLAVFKGLFGFPMFMVLVLLFCIIIWALDLLFFKANRNALMGDASKDPVLVEYAKSFFPIIFVVFVVRSFLVEPFKIPSASMMPTLIAGDFILVNKYKYGLRVPVLNNVFFNVGTPQRGDIFVFHYPVDPKIDFIKRVVGLPGDTIQYQDKVLKVNGKQVPTEAEQAYEYMMEGANIVVARKLQEQLSEVKHDILIHEVQNNYPANSLGERLLLGETITVPEGHYYAMGDNRDNSSDSRVWGFVPEQNLVGKAFFIWLNFGDYKRIGTQIQ